MKKLIYIFTLLLAFTSYSQNPAKLKNGGRTPFLDYTHVTTSERNAMTVPTTSKRQIYNITTSQFEYWDGDSWEVFSGGGNSLLETIVNPLNVYYGTRLQPITTNSGFFTSSSNNNATGYLAENLSTGNGAYSGFVAKGIGAAFTNSTALQQFNSGYYESYLANNSLLYATEDLIVVSGKNTGDIQFRLGNTTSPSVTQAATDLALHLKADRNIIAPSLTTALISAEPTGKSLVTKEWVVANPGVTIPLNEIVSGTGTGITSSSTFQSIDVTGNRTIYVGTEGISQGSLNIQGDALANGGFVNLYNGNNADTDANYYRLQAQKEFEIYNESTSIFKIDDVTDVVSAPQMSIAEIDAHPTNDVLVTKEWVTANTGVGLNNIVEDTTPQLGGTLDANNNYISNLTQIQGSGNFSINSSGHSYWSADTNIGITIDKNNTTTTSDFYITHDNLGSPGALFNVDESGLITAPKMSIAEINASGNTTLITKEWVTANTGEGDVIKVGTPVDNQIGIWTGDGILEGTAKLTFDGTTFKLTEDADTFINIDTTNGLIARNADNEVIVGSGWLKFTRNRSTASNAIILEAPIGVDATITLPSSAGILALTSQLPTVEDTAYGVSWNGNTNAATKNAIYDKIETLGGGGTIGGSIVDNQIAVGATTSNNIEGDANFTWNGTSLTVNGSIVKSGGTSSQFLKADGSVDSSTYLTGNQTITLTGDATGSGTTAITVAVIDDSHNHIISNVDGLQTELDKHDIESKSITIEDPTASEDITLFFTGRAITITQLNAVNLGTTPSVTYTIRHNSDRNATGNQVVTGGSTTTSTTTGNEVTSFNDATIPADNWVWFETTAKTGTVDMTNITITYTVD